MKILVMSTVSSDVIPKKLLEDTRVEQVWHFGVDPIEFPMDRYTPLGHNQSSFLTFIENNNIDLIVPCALRFYMWDQFIAAARKKNIPMLMPNYQLGLLGWNLSAGKKLLSFLNIPTPAGVALTRSALTEQFHTLKRPFVIKYEKKDRRVGSHTMVITNDNVDAEYKNFTSFPDKVYSVAIQDAEPIFLVEDYIDQTDAYSWHALCNETGWKYLGSASAYKNTSEDSEGRDFFKFGFQNNELLVDPRINNYAEKIVNFLKQRGTPYVGALGFKIVIAKDGTPIVLEIKTSAGGHELESIIPTIDTPLLDIFYATAKGDPIPEIKFNANTSISVKHAITLHSKALNRNGSTVVIKLADNVGASPAFNFFLKSQVELIESGFGRLLPYTNYPAGWAEVDGKIVGMMVYEIKPDRYKTTWVLFDVIDPEYRNTGINHLLYFAGLTHVRGLGSSKVACYVHVDNIAQQECLEQVGMKKLWYTLETDI